MTGLAAIHFVPVVEGLISYRSLVAPALWKAPQDISFELAD